jgi:1,4-alpha-glucan branching enzyme
MVTLEGSSATFRFLRPHARRVCLAGEFNGWRIGDLPMTRAADGFWTATLSLPRGEYRFRYWADDQWFIDYAAFGVEHGPFGLDGVVRIPEAAKPAACDTCPHVQAA